LIYTHDPDACNAYAMALCLYHKPVFFVLSNAEWIELAFGTEAAVACPIYTVLQENSGISTNKGTSLPSGILSQTELT